MASYAAVLYCSSASKKWINAPTEDHILFVVCHPNTAKPLIWKSAEKPTRDDAEQFRPLPFVKEAILNSPKMVCYAWSQIKDFVAMIPYNPQYGEGQLPPFVKPPPRVPGAAPSAAAAASASPREGLPPPPTKAPTRELPSTRELPPTRELPAPTPAPSSAPAPASAPAPVSSRQQYPKDPVLDALVLPDSVVTFLSESDLIVESTTPAPRLPGGPPTGRPGVPRGAPPLNRTEITQLTEVDKAFGDLQDLVSSFNEPQPSKDSSSFTQLGLASYFGLQAEFEDEKFKPPKVDIKIPPPITGGPPRRAPPSAMPPGPPGGPPSGPPPSGLPPVPGQAPPSNAPPSLPPTYAALNALPDPIFDGLNMKLTKNEYLELVGQVNQGVISPGLVNFVMALQTVVAKNKKVIPTLYCVNSEFYANSKDGTKIFEFVDTADLVSYDRVFVPIFEAGSWSLAVVGEGRMEYYDSTAQKGDDVAKQLSKFFKEASKAVKKESKARKGIGQKKWDSLKADPQVEDEILVKPEDNGLFLLSALISVIDRKPVTLATNARELVARRLVEMMNFVKPMDVGMLRDLGNLADQALPVQIIQEDPATRGKKKKDKRKTLAPGAVAGSQ